MNLAERVQENIRPFVARQEPEKQHHLLTGRDPETVTNRLGADGRIAQVTKDFLVSVDDDPDTFGRHIERLGELEAIALEVDENGVEEPVDAPIERAGRRGLIEQPAALSA